MKSFPFDSEITYDKDGMPLYDRGIDSKELRSYYHLLYTDGVFPEPSDGLQVRTYSQDMSVAVQPGNVNIQGALGREENTRVLVFEAAGTANDRIDSVVARLNINHDYRKIDLYVLKGVEASEPVAPQLTREGGIYELRLANVFIARNTATISEERITDTRLNPEDCGIVTCNPKAVDTGAIFRQYQAALNSFLSYAEDCVDGTTMGNLQQEIERMDTRLGGMSFVSCTQEEYNALAVKDSKTLYCIYE